MISTVQMLQADEGLKYNAYKDTVGKTTVGIGFNMDSPSAKNVWVQANIRESFNLVKNSNFPLSTASIASLVNTCINNCKIDLRDVFDDFDTYPNYVQLALINLMFNMGKHTFEQFYQFCNFIEDDDYDGASNDLKSTKWASQLPERAKRVMALLKGDDSGYSAYLTNSSSDTSKGA